MDIKYSDGLEFKTDDSPDNEPVDSPFSKEQEEALKVIIREGFRAPVGASDDIRLLIGGKSYTVFNVSVSGLGIFLDESDELPSDSTIEGMVLQINGNEFTVSGDVIHISQDESQYLCGIHLAKMDNDCKKELLIFLQNSRNSLFS